MRKKEAVTEREEAGDARIRVPLYAELYEMWNSCRKIYDALLFLVYFLHVTFLTFLTVFFRTCEDYVHGKQKSGFKHVLNISGYYWLTLSSCWTV